MEAELSSETLVLTYPTALCLPQNTGNFKKYFCPGREANPDTPVIEAVSCHYMAQYLHLRYCFSLVHSATV